MANASRQSNSVAGRRERVKSATIVLNRLGGSSRGGFPNNRDDCSTLRSPLLHLVKHCFRLRAAR